MVVERVTPDDLVNRFCSKLGLTRQVCREVAELTVKNAETGRPPSSIVAAAIYLTSGKSQREIKEAFPKSPLDTRLNFFVTVRECERCALHDHVFVINKFVGFCLLIGIYLSILIFSDPVSVLYFNVKRVSFLF